MTPKVSVVITSYNQRDYLREAVESVMAQTLRPHEILVADDGSPDDSPALIREYASRHPGWVKGVLQPRNVGTPRNRTAALKQATGDFVALLDGDDRYLPQNLERQLAALASDPGTQACYTNLHYIDAAGRRLGVRDRWPRPAGDIFYSVALGQMGHLRSMVVRYELARQAGFMDERFPHHDGYVFTLRVARLTRFAYLSEPLAEKREHRSGVSKGHSQSKRVRLSRDLYAEVQGLIGGLSPEQARDVKRSWQAKILAHRLLAERDEQRPWRAWLLGAAALASRPRLLRRALRIMREY